MKPGIGNRDYFLATLGEASMMDYIILEPSALQTMAAEDATIGQDIKYKENK